VSVPRLPPGVSAPAARRLFSEHFLADRLPVWPEFAELDTAVLHAQLLELWRAERMTLATANEGQTEERFIRPVLRLLGHAFTLFADIPDARRTPDYFFYTSDVERAAADEAGGWARIQRAVAVGDAKRFDLPLDRRAPEGEPVAQIREYILLSKRPFGLLTNGRLWRLYARDVGLLERACHEIDLGRLLDDGSPGDVRYFAAFFRAYAFTRGPDGRSFLERALDDSALHAVEVSDALERAVFAAVPPIAEGLLADEPRTRDALDDAFANALVFLYRVLFCLFAEARDLLPVSNTAYRRYSISDHRLTVAELIDQHEYLPPASDELFSELRALFRMVDRGDPALGVTEYDGGLFDPTVHPWLEGRSVSDSALAPALDGIYRAGGQLVDYADLSVRTLGTVYERLLAWELVEREGALALAESPRRHETGSYFTPEPVVDAIVERTLDPLVSLRSDDVRDRGLRGDAALDALLAIRVLDPAMGSGHFLVGAADFLAQAIATDPSYDGDLSVADLTRLVAERCLYGVDLNPLAVELARLSLWLVTAREGEPLTFLGNLRVGDSLVGADTETLLDPTTGLLEAHLAASAGELLGQVNDLQRRATASGADAREKRRLADQIEGLRLPLEVFAERSIERFQPPGGRPRLHWPLEFPEMFVGEDGRPLDDGGFDAVIGNPPYIRVQEIGRDVADYCRARFETPRGSFDAYLVFIERGLSLLAAGGRLGFIVPNKLFKLDFAQRMREMLAQRELVEEVLDFGASQLFAGATNYTCILLLARAGAPELTYRRLSGRREEVLGELSAGGTTAAQRFAARNLGGEPWVLVPPEEAEVIACARKDAVQLGSITAAIFTGLQTNADDVYIVEDRGWRGGLRIVWSHASRGELELEPDLLHPLASGVDVERYAFRPLTSLLLFPYVRDGDTMRLVLQDELRAVPRTYAYLTDHEPLLRGRERGRMDHDGWYGYVYPKSLGAHDSPKLGVAATVRRLEIAADLEGAVYFHNVRVNGILPRADGPTLPALLVLLNSRLLDWIFRRGAAPHANDYYAANRQFIAGLPIASSEGSDARRLDELGRSLHDLAASIASERQGFTTWLRATLEPRPGEGLPGQRVLEQYERATADELVRALGAGHARLGVDPRERATRELVEREHRASVSRLLPLLEDLARAEAAADDAVYELYGMPARMRTRIDSEYSEAVRVR
jgi:hypothetical protein